jgi:hypothetical protein
MIRSLLAFAARCLVPTVLGLLVILGAGVTVEFDAGCCDVNFTDDERGHVIPVALWHPAEGLAAALT